VALFGSELRVDLLEITMMTTASHDVTQLLIAWRHGDEAAGNQLIPLVYGQLRRIARNRLRGEFVSQTLQSTDLINETYLRLVAQSVDWQSRAHFYGIAARLMRQILVDKARSRHALKRGGDQEQISLDEADGADGQPNQGSDLLALNEALETLAKVDPHKSQIVELRFFGGLTIEETAEVMGVSTPTVQRHWRAARAWLQTELG
jgi:RNA polymerase sigma factor (TIGR02999 family)